MNTVSIRIAPIERRHIDSFHDALDSVARERRFLAMFRAPPLENIRGFITRNIDNDHAQFVALDGEVVVGWCDVLPAWADALRHRGTLGMGVRAAYRGCGIGSQLLAATIAKAQANGIDRIELEVRTDNLPAIALYRRFGFEQDGVLRHAMQVDGTYFDCLRMSLLAPHSRRS
jgi:ribosomal protein S18 acetylase RimI-like enzyme